MERDEIALRIFCAVGPKLGLGGIDPEQEFGERQIRACFHLADRFQHVAAEPVEPTPVSRWPTAWKIEMLPDPR